MDGKKSKFDFGPFYDGYDYFVVNKDKYTKEEAIEIYKQEYQLEPGQIVKVGEAWVRHRAGINGDGEPCVGWWVEYEDLPRCCPVWIMHLSWKGSEIGTYETYTVK